MSDSKPESGTQYRCGNCRAVADGSETEDTNYGNPICPECNVEELTEMDRTSCLGCGCQEFHIIEPAKGESITGADPNAECVQCGRSGQIDDSRVWW